VYVQPCMSKTKTPAAEEKKAGHVWPEAAHKVRKKGDVCIYRDFTGLEMFMSPHDAAVYREEQNRI
jgi:hypothetical protein